MVLNELVCETVNWLRIAERKDRCFSPANTRERSGSIKGGDCLIISATVGMICVRIKCCSITSTVSFAFKL